MESIACTRPLPRLPSRLPAWRSLSRSRSLARGASVTYPLPAVLALTATALLCAHISVLVIAEWGRQSSDLLATLGFPNVATPPDDPAPALLRKPDARILAAIRHLAFDRRQEYRQSRSRDRWEGTATPTPGGRGGRCGARPVRWGIEHRSHRARNVTLGEEASLIHLGQGPAVFTILRSAALSLRRPSGCHRITSRLRYHSQHPEEALALLLDTALARAWALDSMPRWSSSC